MQFWLMRHGEAEQPYGGSDRNRALTPTGINQLQELANYLIGRFDCPKLIMHSPLRRAKQTAETIAAIWTATEPGAGPFITQETPLLEPGFSPQTLLDAVMAQSTSPVLCVGHQPDIGIMADWLTGCAQLSYRPGTLSIFDGPSFASQGMWTLAGHFPADAIRP